MAGCRLAQKIQVSHATLLDLSCCKIEKYAEADTWQAIVLHWKLEQAASLRHLRKAQASFKLRQVGILSKSEA